MEFPMQESRSEPLRIGAASSLGGFDMRDHLEPRRLTIAMWDHAYLMRHVAGGSFEDYDRVLDEAVDRGYNTLRLEALPQLVDLTRPEKVITWPDPGTPFIPWFWNTSGEGPLGQWLIEFMEKLLARGLHYTLSSWWMNGESADYSFCKECRVPRSHCEAAELWRTLLQCWKSRFGFGGLEYVDISNEVPYFLPGFAERIKAETDHAWGDLPHFSQRQVDLLVKELNPACAMLRREFPEVRFTASIHGDTRWVEVPVQFDCLDVHFYADADSRWSDRTRFVEFAPHFYSSEVWHAEFSERCTKTHGAMAPMLRAQQRSKVAAFASWGRERGMPLTTSESWASWYYSDSSKLDWGWLLEWAEWSVEDAIDFGMWGWTPHNYCHPGLRNWQDARWHRRLTERFLRS